MKKITNIILLLLLCIACSKTASKKKNNIADETSLNTNEMKETISSGDYSTLLTNFECNMTISELAKVLKVPEADLSISKYTVEDKCLFELKGFGGNGLDDHTGLLWGPEPSSKAQNKKEIKGFLDRERNNENFWGMGIELSETGDCYIAYAPLYGRVYIYNEQYDPGFLISYGNRITYPSRTKEQHKALKQKMIDVANYLVKKHKK